MRDGEQIAQAFVTARRAARGLADYPGPMPLTLSDAYAIQSAAVRMTGSQIGGWKVGKIPPPLDALHGTDRLAGPIFADRIAAVRPGLTMPVFADGFAAAEAEYLLRIGRSPDRGKRYSLHEALDLIDAVHIGIEIASSPFPGINAHGPAITVSDFGNNFGLVIGGPVPEPRTTGYLDWPVALRIDEDVVGEARARDMLDGPVGAVAFLLNLAAEHDFEVESGQWISTGAVTGVHPVRPGQTVTALFNGNQEVSCAIDAATAQEEERAHGK
jgi:2-keto-4-pentenoate hydratase